jgi:5-dehydro-2-deoxygluconokinase
MKGYTQNLFILPFDHRGSFIKGLLEKDERFLTENDRSYIASQKKIIYKAFLKAIKIKIPKQEAAILIDEEFGDEIIKDAKEKGINILLTVEKSGQKEFEFEYEEFQSHIEKYSPLFVKVLIRYNPDDSLELKRKQQEKLKILSDYCLSKNYKFLLEVLVEPSEEQLKKANGDKLIYINQKRPFLAARVIEELQNSEIEVDVWKLEGTENSKGYEEIIKSATREGRGNVGVVILGGGQDRKTVEEWIIKARSVKGIIGFAVGRTIFWGDLLSLKEKKISEEKVIDKISENFIYFYDIFKKEKK